MLAPRDASNISLRLGKEASMDNNLPHLAGSDPARSLARDETTSCKIAAVWLFSIWRVADLIVAFAQRRVCVFDAGALGRHFSSEVNP